MIDGAVGEKGLEVHTHVPEDDAQVDIIEELDLGVSVNEPEWDWDDEAKQVGNCNPLVTSTDGEHVAGDGPSDGEGVVLLDILAGPDIGAFDGGEDLVLVGHDGLHHYVVKDSADDGSEHLRGKSASG